MTTIFDEPENNETKKTTKEEIDQVLLMTHAEDASLLYKMAGTVISSQ